ncbi:MAG: 2-C-methyl-D-erythritol 4-phosphate cytidylyltransferase [Muribaculaceae bacterium]|nr:2-C-methyl-D-erythritol 4-phosphate cytidylyltransferase [Muribaculaceae bacterium]
MKAQHIYNIIVAAGSGSRFGAALPKQYCLMNGRPVLMHTIENMRVALPDSHIVLVLNKDFVDYWAELCEQYSFVSPRVVVGGDSRWQSVKNAVDTIPREAEVITVHDGARPIVDRMMVERLIAALEGAPGAIPVVSVTDSLRRVNEQGSAPVDRSQYKAVQTPQAFHADKLVEAYSLPFNPTFTDDASVMAALGCDVALVEGDTYNIKITNPLDIEIAQLYLRQR